jgi:hypothetical protein
MWQTIHCNVISVAMASISVMDFLNKAGIWREVKVMSNSTTQKTGMPHFDAPELETMLQQRQRLSHIVIPYPSTHEAASASFLWQRNDEMVDAWSMEVNIIDTDAKKARAKALEKATDNVLDAYINVARAHDVIPYMHEVSNKLSIYMHAKNIVYSHDTLHVTLQDTAEYHHDHIVIGTFIFNYHQFSMGNFSFS